MISTIEGWTLVTVFFAGMASFLSPCVLPIVPGYISYFSATGTHDKASSTHRHRARTLALSAAFVFGFSVVFIAMGASLSLLGQLFLSYRHELTVASGALVILAGLSVMGLLRLPMWLQRYYQFRPAEHRVGLGKAIVVGFAFGFGWTPCIGPVLAGILMLGASTASATQATALLAVYALGLGVPFLLSAYFMTPFMQRLRTVRRVGLYIRVVSGLLLVVMGVAMATGELTRFAIWIYESFPILGRLG